MIRWIALVLGVAGLIVRPALSATAQTAPAPAASPPETPVIGVTGPAYGVNDPCTSLGAIVSRPSQTTSVCTVRSGHVLIETGYENTDAEAVSTTVQYPQAFVRIGTVVPVLEVDLGLPVYERLREDGATSSGTTDVGGGLKYVFGYTPRFNYGASAFFTEPTGTNGFSAGAGTAAYNLNCGYTLNSVWSLAGTLGFNSLSNGTQRYSSTIPSLVLTAGLPNASGVFLEGAEFTHGAGPGTPTRLQLLGGVTRGLTPRSQIDLEVGGSPTSATGRYRFVGFGASYYL
jgi:hypothetical protein